MQSVGWHRKVFCKGVLLVHAGPVTHGATAYSFLGSGGPFYDVLGQRIREQKCEKEDREHPLQCQKKEPSAGAGGKGAGQS